MIATVSTMDYSSLRPSDANVKRKESRDNRVFRGKVNIFNLQLQQRMLPMPSKCCNPKC